MVTCGDAPSRRPCAGTREMNIRTIVAPMFVAAAVCISASLAFAQTPTPPEYRPQNPDASEPEVPLHPDLPPQGANPIQPSGAPERGAPTEGGAPSLPGLERGPLVTPAGRRDEPEPPTAAPSGAGAQQMGAGAEPQDGRPDSLPDKDALPPSMLSPAAAEIDDLPPAGELVGEGDALVDVQVKGAAGDDYNAPLANQRVELSIIRPPHEVVETQVAVSGDDGIARFRVQSGDELQGFARLLKEDREVFAPNGIFIESAGKYALKIQDKPVVSDASVVFAPRVITIVELWEDYLVFTQIFRLATDQPVIFEAEKGGRDAGLHIPVPDGAAGINVVQPKQDAEAVGDGVMFRGQILPAGEAGERPTLIVRYSIMHSNVANVAWSQVFPFDVENLSLVVPQISQHERHKNLNVLLDVPLCDDEGRAANEMCFSHVDEAAEGVDMLRGTAVRVAHGGTVRAGGRMEVETTGWPADPHLARWAAGFALLGALLLAWLMWMRGRRRGSDEESELTRLKLERKAILKRVDALEQQLADAAILEMDYEAQKERIIGELALVERRIRGQRVTAEHG